VDLLLRHRGRPIAATSDLQLHRVGRWRAQLRRARTGRNRALRRDGAARKPIGIRRIRRRDRRHGRAYPVWTDSRHLRTLTDHITHGETKSAVEQMYQATSIAPEDVAEVIAFAVSRPRSVSLNEILVRPTGQAQ
jgi:hypothetical protein